MSNITADLLLDSAGPAILNRREDSWSAVVLVYLNEPITTFARPLNVITVVLEASDDNWLGYYGTGPLRRLEGEEVHGVDQPITRRIDLLHELKSDDSESFRSFPAGPATLRIRGVLWAKSGPLRFDITREVLVV